MQPPAFGQLLRQLRLAADLTQEELAERAGVSTRLVSDLERGLIRRPRRDTIRMLADGLSLASDARDEFTAVARGKPLDAPSAVEQPAASGAPSSYTSAPLPPGPLIGRERELAATSSLLNQTHTRVLTLTGPGGVGKTRLSLEVALRVVDAFPGGVVFVDLTPVSDPALAPSTIARSFGLRDDGETPPVDALVAHLESRADGRVLLVLDNLEHLPGATPMIGELLRRSARLTILATSRRPLRLRVEREYAVAPLAIPDPAALPPLDDLARVPAVDLLVRQAEAARHSFALTEDNAASVAGITVRLDGLPLAIELAAARLRVLSPAELLARLERRLPLLSSGAVDLPERQQTLRSTIRWSYDLLTPLEQQLFRLCAVFAGGIALDAVEAIGEALPAASDAHDQPVVLDALSTLVSQSLLRVLDPPEEIDFSVSRFGMLETIREFGVEMLRAEDELVSAHQRQMDWVCDLVERADPELTGPDQHLWLARLRVENANLRAALAWAIEQNNAVAALRMTAALYRFWATEGLYAEARRWYQQALALDAGTESVAPEKRANALLGAGVIAYFQGDYDRSAEHTLAAQAIFSDLDNTAGVAYTFGNLGLVADAEENYDLAVERYSAALKLFQQIGDRVHEKFMLGNLGLIAYFQERYAAATDLLEESIAIAEEQGDRHSATISRGNLGLVAFARGEYARAQDLQRESLMFWRDTGSRPQIARSFENMALVAAATGQHRRAARLFGAADALRTRLGAPLQPNDREFNTRYSDRSRNALGESAFTDAWNAGANLDLDDVLTYALQDERTVAARE